MLPAFVQFQLHQDHLVLTTTTYSEKINEMNACPVLKRTNPNITSEPECSSCFSFFRNREKLNTVHTLQQMHRMLTSSSWE